VKKQLRSEIHTVIHVARNGDAASAGA